MLFELAILVILSVVAPIYILGAIEAFGEWLESLNQTNKES